MILKKLEQLGAIIGPDQFVKKECAFIPPGSEDVFKFDIFVKLEMSAADYEFINVESAGLDDRHLMARRIHRMVRVLDGDGSDESAMVRIPFETASRFSLPLQVAMCLCINEVEREMGKPQQGPGQKVTSSRRKKSSGANSSLQA